MSSTKFDFDAQIGRLDRANLLYQVVVQGRRGRPPPRPVSNVEMGYLYEELIRRFSELSNETAGEHFTPREVIRLMVEPPLHRGRRRAAGSAGIVRTLYDPACGTGGMLSVAEEYLRELNPDARLEVFGQELNAETYAICRSRHDAQGPERLEHRPRQQLQRGRPCQGERYDYLLANPPFGVEWKKVETRVIEEEHETQGFAGRFGAGLPRINDGSFLFLQHMISKMKPPRGGRQPRSPSSSTARRSSPAARARARARSGAGSSRTTGWRRSSPCPTSSSTTPASAPTSGSSPTGRPPSGAGQGPARRCRASSS